MVDIDKLSITELQYYFQQHEDDDDSEGLGDEFTDSEGHGHDDDEHADDDDVEGSYGSHSDGSWKPGTKDAEAEPEDAEDEPKDGEDEQDVRRKRPMDEQVHHVERDEVATREEADENFFEHYEYHSEEEGIVNGNDDENAEDVERLIQFNKDATFGQVHLELEMVFPTLNLFKMAVRDYNIALARPVKMKLNDSSRWEDHWEKQSLDPILPPNYSGASGRPKMKRTKGNDIPQDPYKAKRKYRKIRCGKCGQLGHNRRKCKGTTVKDKENKKVPDASTSSDANDPMGRKGAEKAAEATAPLDSNAQPQRRKRARTTRASTSTDITGPSSSNVQKGRKGAEKAAEATAPLDSNAQPQRRKRARTTRASTSTDITGPSSSNVQKGRKGAEKVAETAAPEDSNAQLHRRKKARTTRASTAT
ncbi:hypothetical protein CRG98_041187 [Punica granatum]|uniref:CCHC-type domain-containing protein n=1 Tax=Punica granatum TaxID=22663 RepID=A0A2I0I397_PUNGR|nr:hypothetical protein CRG98_041187 [Punica granatum]